MRVLLLGTGSADGWPNAFCGCASCTTQRGAGVLRRPTSALIDGRILLDFGPHVSHAAQAAGGDLAEIAAVFVTHAHSDHCDPAQLFYRGWVNERPLPVYGPAPVVESIRPWLNPDGSAVRLHPVAPGDLVHVCGYAVRVLPADHHAFGDAVLYDVTVPSAAAGGRAARLLYATDTGPWTAMAGELIERYAAELGPYDVVLLEETFGERAREPGHHDLASFGEAVADLRRWHAADTKTQLIAVHLSHHNPPEGELQERLAALGAHPGRDLAMERCTVPT